MGIKTKIRTLRFRVRKSISEIARRTGLSRNTVKKRLRAPEESEPRYERRDSAIMLTPYAEWLE